MHEELYYKWVIQPVYTGDQVDSLDLYGTKAHPDMQLV